MKIVLILVGLLTQTHMARAENWQKTIECRGAGGGSAYLDVDLANRYNVQFVIKNSSAVEYLTQKVFKPCDLQFIDNGRGALVQARLSQPVFLVGDFVGFSQSGNLGNNWGPWCSGVEVKRSGQDIVIDIVNNYYEECPPPHEIDSDGRCNGSFVNWVHHPKQYVKNWIFRDCQ